VVKGEHTKSKADKVPIDTLSPRRIVILRRVFMMAITACFYLVPILLLFLAAIPRVVLVSIVCWLLFPFYLTVSLVTEAKIQEQILMGVTG
jgi:hypothetical protein